MAFIIFVSACLRGHQGKTAAGYSTYEQTNHGEGASASKYFS